MSSPTALLTTDEIAALLHVHPKHVYRLLRRGLPARKIGSEWRYDASEVRVWVEGAATTATTPAADVADLGTAPQNSPPPPLIAANGDVAIDLLLLALLALSEPFGLVPADRATALRLLAGGRVLVAGCHGDLPPSHLASVRLARIHVVDREVGLCARRARDLPALERLDGAMFAARPPTAGIRIHLDRALRDAGIEPAKALVRARMFDSHRDVAHAVVRGEATVGLVTGAWAARVGLAFRPLAIEAYGLVLRASDLGDSRVIRLCEVAQSAPFRASLSEIPGYDAASAGDIRYDAAEAQA